jgi:hypothetical protein
MNITKLKELGHGIECQVYKVNVKIVCKSFVTRLTNEPRPKRAEFAYRMQKVAYRYNLAPRPLALEDNQVYSEYAESFESMRYSGTWYDFQQTQEFKEFIKRLENILGRFVDSHSGNIARLSNGKLCCIDFGICGFTLSRIGNMLAKKLKIKY